MSEQPHDRMLRRAVRIPREIATHWGHHPRPPPS
jgi:hypothetical protein